MNSQQDRGQQNQDGKKRKKRRNKPKKSVAGRLMQSAGKSVEAAAAGTSQEHRPKGRETVVSIPKEEKEKISNILNLNKDSGVPATSNFPKRRNKAKKNAGESPQKKSGEQKRVTILKREPGAADKNLLQNDIKSAYAEFRDAGANGPPYIVHTPPRGTSTPRQGIVSGPSTATPKAPSVNGSEGKNEEPVPTFEEFKDFQTFRGTYSYRHLQIELDYHSYFTRVAVYVKGKKKQAGMNHRSEILLEPDAPAEKIRPAVFENVLRVLGYSDIVANTDSNEKREPFCPISEPILNKDYIFKLKKKSGRFPLAVYFCRVCDYHINSISHASHHMLDQTHMKAKQDKQMIELLKVIPEPTEKHVEAVNKLIESVAESEGRPVEDLQKLSEIAEKLTEEFHEFIHRDCYVRVYGSCLSGVSLKSHGNLNLELVYPKEANHAKVLIAAETFLKEHEDDYFDVIPDYTARWPHVKFRSNFFADVECVLSVRNSQANEISRLIQLYSDIWRPFRKLAQVFRYWAKMCDLVDFQTGGLPSYVFDLMLIHFLQQTKPRILPVVHEAVKVITGKEDISEEDIYKTDIVKALKTCWNQTEGTLGLLWIKLLKFYACSVDLQSIVVQITQKAPLSREAQGWNRKRIVVQDPYLRKKNVAAMTNGMFEYFLSCFQLAYKYFGIPQTSSGALFQCTNGRLVVRGWKNDFPGEDRIKDEGGAVEQSTSADGMGSHGEGSENSGKKENCEVDDGKGEQTELKRAELFFYDRLKLVEVGSGCLEVDCDGLNFSCLDLKICRSEVKELSRGFESSVPKKSEIVEDCDVEPEPNCSVGQPVAGSSNIVMKKSKIAEDVDVFCCSVVAEKVDAPSNSEIIPQETCEAVESVKTVERFETKQRCNSVGLESSDLASEKFENVEQVEDGEKQRYKNITLEDLGICRSETEAVEGKVDSNNFEEQDLERLAFEDLGIYDDELLGKDWEGNRNSESGSELREEEVEEVLKEEQAPLEEIDEEEEKRKKELIRAAQALSAESLKFCFEQFFFTEGKRPELLCSYCNGIGHFVRNCPDKILPPLVDLPPMNPKYMELQKQCFHSIQDLYQISHDRLEAQEAVRFTLEETLKEYWPDARLSLFGSSINGFGFVNSDLDFCLRFTTAELPENVDPVIVIRRVARLLSKKPEFKEIIPVTGAKVPIVKFYHMGIQLEGDISLYNVLALRNTELMSTYCRCDERLKQLGYVVKVFAKNCDIGDASKGSLSSYAFVIMMIHYLQQCDPPVLPVLQETYDGPRPLDLSEFKRDGWNTYFFDRLEILDKLWSQCGLNKQNCAKLWLGFLRYFTETFSFDTDVIQIRQRAKVTKFEKLWTDRPMALEDPFDLSHNLASGLSKKMFSYIRRCFIRAREVFGCWDKFLLEVNPHLIGTDQYLENFFMERCKLNEDPPQDRQCRFCKRVGHFVENCPLRKSNRKQTIEDGIETWELEYQPRPKNMNKAWLSAPAASENTSDENRRHLRGRGRGRGRGSRLNNSNLVNGQRTFQQNSIYMEDGNHGRKIYGQNNARPGPSMAVVRNHTPYGCSAPSQGIQNGFPGYQPLMMGIRPPRS